MIDRNELTPEQKIFFDGAVEAGFPVDDAAFRRDLQQLAKEVTLPIANPSRYSAFWNFVEAALAAPFRAITRYLVTTAMPGFYVKTATGAQLDVLAWAHGLTRKPAVKMTGKLTFSRAAGATGDVEIPAGTRVRTIALNGTVYRVITTATIVIAADTNAVKVPVEAENPGKGYNLGTGYYTLLDSDVPRIGAITNAADYLLQPGADSEPDDELRLRIRDRFLAVGEWHTDAKYRAMIASRAGIRPDRIYFEHYTGVANPNLRGPGSANAYIIFDAGTTPEAYLADLNNYISGQGNHGHGDDLVCKTIPTKSVTLTVTVRFAPEATAAQKSEAKTDITQRIRCAFWDNSDFSMTRAWPYSRYSFSRLASELHEAVPLLAGVTFNLTDIVAGLEQPKLTTLTVTEAS